MDDTRKDCPQEEKASTENPFARIMRHRRNLDDALISIRGYTDESKLVRSFIVGQIEALDVAIRFFEVG